MLRLKNIKKNYKVADTQVNALKGIELSFRKNEFVSILGPSGCGKTTLLNIIGGLDKYSSGDLFISGKSTKDFKDKDWDTYRNHRIGFIFQSYNLIPHQTILGNVELALSIGGLSKNERTEKAKKALDRVGLKGQYNKKPNQLSGGQCQRVAVARALVNDPDILLADEPTGALDTITSVQIMDLIKEIAEEKLVIMVTHNPELAESYSTRIIRMLDGEITEDSNPFTQEEEIEECRAHKENYEQKSKKSKMSFFTSFKLSLKNLFSKKVRTILTSIAGAIGIIGISLVLSISNGVRTYITDMQDDMLSGNPITISKEAMNMDVMMAKMTMDEKKEVIKETGFVGIKEYMEYWAKKTDNGNYMIENEITQDYVDYVQSIPKEHVAATFLDYGIDVANSIYTPFTIDKTKKENLSLTAIKSRYYEILQLTKYKEYASLISSLEDSFKQAPNDEEYILSQYNKLTGKMAKEKNEIMIVLNKDRQIADLTLAQLGYYSQDEFLNLIYKTTNDERYDKTMYTPKFSYEELMGKTFTWYPNDEIFDKGKDEKNPFIYKPVADDFDKSTGIELKIVGILEPKEGIEYGCLTNGFYYTEALTKEIMKQNKDSGIVKYIKDSKKESIMSERVTMKTIVVKNEGVTYNIEFDYEGTHYVVPCALGKDLFVFVSMLLSKDEGQYSRYQLSLNHLGGADMPINISIYPVDFDEKDVVIEYLDKWNSEEDIVVDGKTIKASTRDEIEYTDMLSIVIAMINTMINTVTYALIGFTSLSLVVSCVMIGIITHVSVVDRTKEIGVIRALGGRKRDVSNLFNAETFMIGLTSGLIGIIVTYLLSFIINLTVAPLAGIAYIAIFPWHNALIMVGISILLTLVSGLIPARGAAKKDPVNALRSE